MYSLVEAWAWTRSHEDLVNRRGSPWDDPERRPSHADKRKALQREAVRTETRATLEQGPDSEGFQQLVERLLDFAA